MRTVHRNLPQDGTLFELVQVHRVGHENYLNVLVLTAHLRGDISILRYRIVG